MKNEANLQQPISDIGGKTVQHFPAEVHLVPAPSKLAVALRLDKKPRFLFLFIYPYWTFTYLKLLSLFVSTFKLS